MEGISLGQPTFSTHRSQASSSASPTHQHGNSLSAFMQGALSLLVHLLKGEFFPIQRWFPLTRPLEDTSEPIPSPP